MSSATARTTGDNEFPVLLRLPDLNAPVWPAKGIAAPAVGPSVAATEPAAPPAEVKAVAETTTTTSTVTATTMTVEPATDNASSAPETSMRTKVTQTAQVATQTVHRVTRDVLTEPRYKLLRQLAGGGMLVGGLALTYLVIMGGDNKTPDHITQAETTLEPPVIDVGGLSNPSDSPMVVRPEVVVGDITPVPGPPPLDNDWNLPDDNKKMPDHIDVAAVTPRTPEPGPNGTGDRYAPGVPQPEVRDTYRPETRDPGPSEYQGRIGPSDAGLNGGRPGPTNPDLYPERRPSVVLPNIEGRTYPVTDQARFEYRPPNFPRDAGRVDTARNPAPLPPR